MRFENSSSTLLSITKAKAKMYELGLDEEHHIRLAVAPSSLLIMVIGMLGDLCQKELSEEENEEILSETQKELRNVAKYFDALIQTKLENEHEYYLCLMGAASYYLANMPGSTSVLARRLGNSRVPLTEVGLEFLLEWLLVNDFNNQLHVIQGTYATDIIAKIKTNLVVFYQPNIEAAEVLEELASTLRRIFHERGTDRELLFVDIINTVLLRRISNSTIKLLPEYTKLSIETWLPVLGKSSFINELWPAQKLLGEQGVFAGNSAVIQLPTSAGKTKSAELVIRSAFFSERAKVAVVIAPFRSLCREISDSLCQAFLGEDVLINQLSDVPQIDAFDIELFSQLFGAIEVENPSSAIIISTPEKFVYLLRHKPELADEISLVIYDEGHQFDTGQRGVTYELLLTSLKQKLAPNTQHVLISAVISNAESIGEWLYAGEGVPINGSWFLGTERSVAFSSWTGQRGQFHYVEPLNPNAEEFFVPRVLETTEIPMLARETRQRYFPDRNDKFSIAAYLGLKLSQYGPVAVFCGTKRTVGSICKMIVNAADRIEELFVPISASSQDEISKISWLSSMHLGDSSDMTKAISLGVLPHSANVPNGLRISVEYAMENGLGRCVVCTSTLAQGVNLPIKYLIVSGVFQGRKRISTRDFHNLLGRAGRSGKHTEGSVIFTDTELYDRRGSDQQWHWGKMQSLLDPAQSEHCSSSLLSLTRPFERDPYGIDPIKFLQDPDKYIQLSIEAAKGQDILRLLDQMGMRKNHFKSIESYLLANSSEEDFTEDKIRELYSNTLAYSLADDEEKVKLKEVFIMAARVVNTVKPEKRAVFGKVLLGVAELQKIEVWIDDNIELLPEELSLEQWLSILWPLVTDVAQNKVLDKLIGEGAGIYLAQQWLVGKSYIDILNQLNEREYKFAAGSQQRHIKIDNVVDICDNALSYDVMLVIGAVADLMENREGLNVKAEQIRNLQRSMKLGLSSGSEHWLYSKGLSDRVVCTHLSDLIELKGDGNSVGSSFFEEHRGYIEPALARFPSVFMKAVYP
ncbi:MAG: DEAD/DEAH box helicase [Cycloclasticus sp.]|nr:DEAD/DEAH box helicase [Cycloclasticus sp.]